MEDLSGQGTRQTQNKLLFVGVLTNKDVVVGQETNDKLRDACYASLHPSRLEGKTGYEMVEQTFPTDPFLGLVCSVREQSLA